MPSLTLIGPALLFRMCALNLSRIEMFNWITRNVQTTCFEDNEKPQTELQQVANSLNLKNIVVTKVC